jgi:predicted Zn finger-like uncharacterized protein
MPELVNCPHCEKKLRVPDNLIGQPVKCPTCGKTFTATAASAAAPPPEEKPAPRPAARRPPAEEEQVEDVPRRRRPADADEEEERPRRRPRAEDEEEDEDDRPRRRRPREDEDDEEEDDRPRRRKRRRYAPHRGVLILILAILGFVVCPIFYPVAWIMGNTDIAEIDAGRMDPEGRGLTQAGRIIGMIGTILMLIAFLLACLFGVIGAMSGK